MPETKDGGYILVDKDHEELKAEYERSAKEAKEKKRREAT